jgi:hypothetical protein
VVAAGSLFVQFQNRERGNAGTASAATDKVPLAMVGTWEGRTGGLAAPSDRLRRISVRRGAVGQSVAVVHTAESRALCEYEGVLRKGGTSVRLDMQNVRALPRRSGCEQRMEVTLALEGEKVRWTGPGPAQVLSLASNTAVSESLQGTWQWTGPQGPSHMTIELASSGIRSEAAWIVRQGPEGTGQCRSFAELVSAEEEIVLFSSRMIVRECELAGLQKLTRTGPGVFRWDALALGESGTLRQYLD